MTVNSDQPLLERCPFCDYSLETMPVEHVCPECGQPFDRRWRVFGTGREWGKMTARRKVWTVVGWGALFVLVTTLLWWGGPGPMRIKLTWVCFLLVMTGVVVWDWGRRPRRFVAVGPEGIVLGDRPRRELRKCGWHRVRKVDRDCWGRVRVHLEGEKITWSLGVGFEGEALRCEECIEKHFDLPE